MSSSLYILRFSAAYKINLLFLMVHIFTCYQRQRPLWHWIPFEEPLHIHIYSSMFMRLDCLLFYLPCSFAPCVVCVVGFFYFVNLAAMRAKIPLLAAMADTFDARLCIWFVNIIALLRSEARWVINTFFVFVAEHMSAFIITTYSNNKLSSIFSKYL